MRRLSLYFLLLCILPTSLRAVSYEATYEGWLAELQAAYHRESTVAGDAGAKVSWALRTRNDLLLRGAAEILKFYAPRAKASHAAALLRLGSAAQRWSQWLLSRLPQTAYRAFAPLLEAQKLKGAVDRLRKLEQQMNRYYKDIDRYKAEYGAEFFPKETVARGAINVFLMHLVAAIEGKETSAREAMNAFALLHPVTDGVLDSGNFDPRTMVKITQLLQGKPQTATSPYERLVFAFVEDIYRSYPREQHPALDWVLNKLHREQLRSVTQRSSLNDDTLLGLTFSKGGLSTVAAAYIALGRLDSVQQKFFYKGGAVFQLLDDLMDIPQDAADGIETTWTKALQTTGTVAEPMRKLLQLQRDYENEHADLVRSFSQGPRFAAANQASFASAFLQSIAKNADRRVWAARSEWEGNFSASARAVAHTLKAVRGLSPRPDEASDCRHVLFRLLEAQAIY